MVFLHQHDEMTKSGMKPGSPLSTLKIRDICNIAMTARKNVWWFGGSLAFTISPTTATSAPLYPRSTLRDNLQLTRSAPIFGLGGGVPSKCVGLSKNDLTQFRRTFHTHRA